MIKDFEARMAAVTQQIRKKKDKAVELKKIKKTEKKVHIE